MRKNGNIHHWDEWFSNPNFLQVYWQHCRFEQNISPAKCGVAEWSIAE